MKKITVFLFVFIIFIIISVNYYFEFIGLGDPVRYDKDVVYGIAPKENQKKTRFKNSVVTINESGLRSLENWKNSKKKKILFIGDSVTFGGSFIDDKKIFSYLVCDILKEFSCGNTGVNAYNIINMVNRSRYDERIQDANIVIFFVSALNFTREFTNSETAHFYLNDHKFFLSGLMEAISFFSTKYDLNYLLSKRDNTKKNQHYKELIDYSLEQLVAETERLKKNDKIVKIFFSVERNDKKSENHFNKYVLNKLLDLELENFYSLENELNKDDFFVDNIHLSSKGHEIVAKKIISTMSGID